MEVAGCLAADQRREASELAEIAKLGGFWLLADSDSTFLKKKNRELQDLQHSNSHSVEKLS